MSRPIRIEFPGATYHITSRGHAQASIFSDDGDREFFLERLGKIAERFHWLCHAYCLMTDHYHLVIETQEPNLSAGMRELNGTYTQYYNRRHGLQGSVMQGRFKAILLERETFLLAVCRHVVLNPLRVKAVRQLEKYRWSSYRSSAGLEPEAPGFSSAWIWEQFGKPKKKVFERYQEYIQQGSKLAKKQAKKSANEQDNKQDNDSALWSQVQSQILLGSPAFVKTMRTMMRMEARVQIKPVRPSLKKLFSRVKDRAGRNAAIRAANREHRYRLYEIGEFVGLHLSTISKIANSED